MQGTDKTTGKHIADIDHLRQSIGDILTTRLGSRVMRRDYGSRLFDLIDAPTNRSTILDIYTATADALEKWEPRIEVIRVTVAEITEGNIFLTINGIYRPTGKAIKLERIKIK
jgi:phage baseplate assembly protein W